jgi:hypothetical protein
MYLSYWHENEKERDYQEDYDVGWWIKMHLGEKGFEWCGMD